MNTELMFSSKTDLRATPQEFFDELDKEFHFTLDPCANDDNHKCKRYYTEKEDWLKQSWDNEIVFCNPPYWRVIRNRVKKWYSARGGVVVMLLPARTDTTWFHEYIYHKAEIRFIKWRLKFGDSKNSAPFPSMIVIYKDLK